MNTALGHAVFNRSLFNRQHSVCTVCGSTAQCTGETWHAFAMPPGLAMLTHVPCTRNTEMCKDNIRLPVTHVSTRFGRGLWMYYARGCSDLAWSMGRTLCVRNRYHLALELHRRLYVNSDESEAVKRVADALQRARGTAKWIVRRVNISRTSGHGFMKAYYGHKPNLSVATLVADAARGIFDPNRCHVWISKRPRPLHEVCSGECKVRSRALVFVLHSDAHIMDNFNAAILRRLCNTPAQLDTVQLHQQPAGGHQRGVSRWATEIWDVRGLCSAAASAVFYSWLNGSACKASPPREWNSCWSCSGSALQQNCRAPLVP